uniref:Uncharacterized protein n=1 Tax=Oryza meridionalis TaxID=40149 RepID=A0A0E0FA62_9ORYZ
MADALAALDATWLPTPGKSAEMVGHEPLGQGNPKLRLQAHVGHTCAAQYASATVWY